MSSLSQIFCVFVCQFVSPIIVIGFLVDPRFYHSLVSVRVLLVVVWIGKHS